MKNNHKSTHFLFFLSFLSLSLLLFPSFYSSYYATITIMQQSSSRRRLPRLLFKLLLSINVIFSLFINLAAGWEKNMPQLFPSKSQHPSFHCSSSSSLGQYANYPIPSSILLSNITFPRFPLTAIV